MGTRAGSQSPAPARARNSCRERGSVRRLPRQGTRSPSGRAGGLNAAQCHARMLGPDDDTDGVGLQSSSSHSATCLVRRSCVCGRQAKCSTRRASFDRPRICSPGRYATQAVPTNGSMWCSQIERKGISRARTSSVVTLRHCRTPWRRRAAG